MRKISVGNPTVSNTYRTFLASAYSIGGTSLDVLSNVSFSGNDFGVVGEPAEELTELQTIGSLSGKNTLNLAATLNFNHPKDTPVYKVPWNFVVIEGRALPTDNWQVLTQSPIQWDKQNTVWFHSTGSDSWQYRFHFWNNVANTYSEYSPTTAGSGFTRPSVGYMIRNVRQVTNDLDGRVAGDRTITRFFNECQDIIRGTKTNWSWLKVTDKTVTTVAATKQYGLPSAVGNLTNIADIRYNYNDGTNNLVYALKYLPEVEFDLYDRDQNRTDDDYVSFYTFAEADSTNTVGYIRVEPIPKTTGYGTFWIRYYKDMPDLEMLTDETLVPIPSLLENFAISKVEQLKGNEVKASVYLDLFYGRQRVGRRMLETDGGLNLLLIQDQLRPVGQPMSLIRYKGRHNINRYFNNRFTSADAERENYFSPSKP